MNNISEMRRPVTIALSGIVGEKTVCYQNEHFPLMRQYRDEGPTYPLIIESNFAEITFVEDCGRDNDEVIACAASELPPGYLERRN